MKTALRTFSIAVLFLGLPVSALAHGFGARIDLPVPLSTYLVGASAAVVLSFVFLGLVSERQVKKAAAYPRYDLLRLRLFAWFAKKPVLAGIRLAVLTAALCIAVAGLFGTQAPLDNIAPTVVWIFFGVGMVYVSAFLGDLWRLINPAATLARYVASGFGRLGMRTGDVAWPAWVGVWPAFLGFFFYRWLENVYANSGSPDTLGTLILAYLIVSVAGSLWVGADRWFSHADPFGVFFRFLARFSVTDYVEEAGERRLYLRPPAVGLFAGSAAASFSEVVFVLFMLASVAFDGFATTAIWGAIAIPLFEAGVPPTLVGTLGLAGLLVVFVGAYYGVMRVMKAAVRGYASTGALAHAFVFSLLPIAIGYEVAHYVSLLLVNGQQIIPLLSDPMGLGWNLFGTAQYVIDYNVLNLKALWNWQVALIVLGHAVAVWIAHLDSLRFFPNGRQAILSQLPMLALMIGYTVFSLWLLALPIVIGLE